MDSLVSTFHIDFKLVIAQLINFAVVLILVYYVLGKPLIKMMNKRDIHIKEGIDNAANALELIKKTEEEYEATLLKAKTEASDFFQEVKKQTEAKKSAMLEDARLEVETLIANGQKSLEIEKQKILAEAKKEIVELTITATSKILAEHSGSTLSQDTISKIKSV